MKEAQKYIIPLPYWKRFIKSGFFGHYWRNSWMLVGFSVLIQIALFWFLSIDKDTFWFWVCTWFLLAINLIRFFGLLLKFRI